MAHRPDDQGVHIYVVPGAGKRPESVARCIWLKAKDELEELWRVVGLGNEESADVGWVRVSGRQARGDRQLAGGCDAEGTGAEGVDGTDGEHGEAWTRRASVEQDVFRGGWSHGGRGGAAELTMVFR